MARLTPMGRLRGDVCLRANGDCECCGKYVGDNGESGQMDHISEADAIAEGARHFPDLPSIHPYGQDPRWSCGAPTSTDQCLGSARFAFGNLWESINGAGSWDANPWVWCVTFKKLEKAP